MTPFIVQVITTLVARFITGNWRDSARIGIAVLFMFTAVSHFSSLKHDMAQMIPPPLTGSLWVIYITGIFEFAGGVGLLWKRTRTLAAWCLIVMLLCLLPANIYASMQGLMLGGKPVTPLWIRVPLQFFWIAVIWWSTLARSTGREESLAARN